jgi:hypothetical protein
MKNILILYAAQIGLSLLFVAISVLIFFFGARPGLIKHKLKIGSMLLAFNAMLAGCFNSTDTNTAKGNGDSSTDSDSKGTDIVECYVAPPVDDTDSASAPTATDSESESEIDTEDIMCYDPVMEDSDSGSDSDSDTKEWETDIECYVMPSEDSDSETETPRPDAGVDSDDVKEWESDIECYDMPADGEDI